MPNYKEVALEGTAYTRCGRVTIENSLVYKMITFNEETVAFFDDGRSIVKPEDAVLTRYLNAENAGTSVAILDPETNEASGARMSYAEIYNMLYSLYIHVAAERDAEEAGEE